MIKLFLLLFSFFALHPIPHYYATSADARHFSDLTKLISSIKRNDWQDRLEIVVFNLGLRSDQVRYLQRQDKVKVVELENVNPDALKCFDAGNKRKITGWFIWKPIAIKQALDMYPYVLYLDADMLVLKPLENLFKHIEQNGYFLIDAESKILDRVTKPVLDKIIDNMDLLDKQKVLASTMSCGGIQGLSRIMLKDYVLPIFEHAKDTALFEDDGSAELGLGQARHDQTIFSIYSRLLDLDIQPAGSWATLKVDGKAQKIHLHWDKKQLNEESSIFY